MSASTFQPPIHLDPNQDSAQQLAFINQNFQTIASTLETNSFRIVDRGTGSLSSDGSTVNWSYINHNLGFAPIPFVFLNGVTRTSGSTTIVNDGNLPFPTWSSLNVDTTNHVINFRTFIDCIADDTSVYFFLYNSTGSSISSFDVSYYLCQQPALNV